MWNHTDFGQNNNRGLNICQRQQQTFWRQSQNENKTPPPPSSSPTPRAPTTAFLGFRRLCRRQVLNEHARGSSRHAASSYAVSFGRDRALEIFLWASLVILFVLTDDSRPHSNVQPVCVWSEFLDRQAGESRNVITREVVPPPWGNSAAFPSLNPAKLDYLRRDFNGTAFWKLISVTVAERVEVAQWY